MPERQPIKITEPVRTAMLKRPFHPDVAWDADISGFALHVTLKRAFWAQHYSPAGRNPSTGKRRGSTRFELGDAVLMPIPNARAAALTAKAAVLDGRDPHREKMALRASRTAARSILPQTGTEALDLYVQALTASRERSAASKRQASHYAAKAMRLLRAGDLPLTGIDATLIRVMLETMNGSGAERTHVYGAFRRFMGWCCRQGLIAHNPCDDISADERALKGQYAVDRPAARCMGCSPRRAATRPRPVSSARSVEKRRGIWFDVARGRSRPWPHPYCG
jgi:hypothetical protein